MAIKHDPPLVLIADDQIPTTTMLEHIFQREGYQVKSVYDGVETLETAQQLLPDLILLDINMPKINGLDVLRTLRDTPSTVNIPTILITARGEPDDIAHGLDLGADDYLPKPFHPRELLARAQSKMKARLLEEALQRRTQDLETLLRASEELNQHLEIDDLLDLILYLTLDVLPSDLAVIYRLKDQGKVQDCHVQRKPNQALVDNLPQDEIVKRFSKENLTILWPDDSPPLVPNFESGMAAALRHGTDLHGILLLCAHQPFDSNHYRLFSGIARQATLALRNAELYEIQADYALHLEDMVEARTAELRSAQQLLIQAEKLASVGRLAASVAHEINNPLLPIRINLEHMLEDIQSDTPIDVKEIERTQESVERISRIVNRLLQFTGKRNDSESRVDSLNIAAIIEDVISLNRKYLEHTGMTIDTDLPTLPSIYGSKDQLEQVFMNLVLNAIAAMSPGGKLEISAHADRENLVVKFKDNGCGIPPELIDRIFEPFVSTKEHGTGLGLFITYGIIQNHRGTIEVESQVNKGTTFTVRLPLSVAPHSS